ncbi:Swi5-domain-containing protein [Xylogone sp. PMI_703]|nr:Swi5-domain-containing protein [Xylogone sp. PMI_703]
MDAGREKVSCVEATEGEFSLSTGDVEDMILKMQTEEDNSDKPLISSQPIRELMMEQTPNSESSGEATASTSLEQAHTQSPAEGNLEVTGEVEDQPSSSPNKAKSDPTTSKQQLLPTIKEPSDSTEVQEQKGVSVTLPILSSPGNGSPAKDNSKDTESLQPSTSSGRDREIVEAELRSMKIASIQARNAALEAEIAAKRTELEGIQKELLHPAGDTVKKHIKLLHDYNDIKDIGQGLIGMIADNRGVRVRDLYPEFGLDPKD